MIIGNPQTDINKNDCYGANAFWIASFYGHTEVSSMAEFSNFK
jgi:hypothetical protein